MHLKTEYFPDIVTIGYSNENKPYGAAAVEKNLAAFKNISVIGCHDKARSHLGKRERSQKLS